MEPEMEAVSTVKGMYHLFLGNVAFTLMLGVTAIVVGRILGPDRYGLYTVALIVPQFMFLIVKLGLDFAATRFAARLRSEGKVTEAVSFVYESSLIVVALSLIFTVVLVALSGFIAANLLLRPQIAALILPVAMVSIVGQAAYSVTSLGLTGLGRFDRAALLQVLQGATKLVVTPLLVLLGFGVGGAVGGFMASFMVAGILGLVFVVALGGRIAKGWSSRLKEGLAYGFPVYGSSLAAGFVGPAILTILALTVSNAEIGGYSLAVTITTLITLLTYPIGTALFPLFSKKEEDLKAVMGIYETSVKFTALLVVPLTIYIMAFAGPLMVTIYGRAYSFGAPYLTLLAAISLAAGLGGLSWAPLLNGRGHTKEALGATFVGSLVMVVGAILLIGRAGVEGAIEAQIIGSVVSLVLGTWLVVSTLKATPNFAGALKMYGAGLTAGIFVWPISWLVWIPQVSVVLGAVAFVFLFLTVLAILNALSEEDLRDLKTYVSFARWLSKPLDVAIGYYSSVKESIWGRWT